MAVRLYWRDVTFHQGTYPRIHTVLSQCGDEELPQAMCMEIWDSCNALLICFLAYVTLFVLVLEDPFPFGNQRVLVSSQGNADWFRLYLPFIVEGAISEQRIVLGDFIIQSFLLPQLVIILCPFIQGEQNQITAFRSVEHLALDIAPYCLLGHQLPKAHHSRLSTIQKVIHLRAVVVFLGRLHEVLHLQVAYVCNPHASNCCEIDNCLVWQGA